METEKILQKGVAYHGNRMLPHIRADMLDIVEHGFNTVVHMFTHNDWRRHKKIMAETIAISRELGLDVWIDNWGLGGPPGELSNFLSYYPDEHQYYNSGEVEPIRACYNSEALVKFTEEWIDAVGEIGARKIFWDEPHLRGLELNNGVPGKWTCRCPRCQELFREQYGASMPEQWTPEVGAFRLWSIRQYFERITRYAHGCGMENNVCVMLNDELGICLDTVDQICSLPTVDGVGSDPYWVDQHFGYQDTYAWVYRQTKKNLEVCERFGKAHNVWIQSFANPNGTEEEIYAAADAIYDAGARSIFVWSYHGSDANDYRACNPEMIWKAVGGAMQRISERDREARRLAAQCAMKKLEA